MLLVDCEGIDAFDQTLDYSTQIFSLGVLLSSLLVFNQMGGIDESSIDKLSSVCEFAQLIRSKSAAGADARTLSELSPTFLWLLRDFHYQLTEEGRQLTPRDYMEEVLRDMPGSTEGVQNRNRMRTSIRGLFPERDCFALVRPLLDEGQLAAMDTLPQDKLRPEFRQGLDRLSDLILSRALPKQYRGQYLTGSAIAAFAQAYVDVINKGGVPQISSTWQSVMRSENQRAQDAALAAYERAFATATARSQQQGTPGGPARDVVEVLDEAHTAALGAAMEEFGAQALGDASERKAFEVRLTEAAGSRFAVVRQARLAEADARASERLTHATGKFSALLAADPVDTERLDRELSAFLQEYDAQASGPTKYKRVAEFLVNCVVRGNRDATARAQAAAAAAATKLAASQKESAEARTRVTELEGRLRVLESSETSLKQQLSSQQQEAARLSSQLADRGRQAAEVEVARDAARRELSELNQRVQQLNQRLAAAQSEADAVRSQLGAAQATASRTAAEVAEGGQQLAAARQEVEALRAQLAAARAEASSSASQQGAELARLRSELQFVTSRRDMLQGEVDRSRAAATQQMVAKDATISQLHAELAEARQTAGRAVDSSERTAQLSQQLADRDRLLAERDVTISRLQEERGFLQTQYDNLRRASLPGQGAQDAPAPNPTPRQRKRAEPEVVDVDAMDTEEGVAEGADGAGPSRKKVRVTSRKQNETQEQQQAEAPFAFMSPEGAAGAGVQEGTPFSNEKQVPLRQGTPGVSGGAAGGSGAANAGAATAAGAGGGGGAGASAGAAGLTVPSNLSRMTIQEMKNWLTDNKFEADVFTYNNRKPAPKKDDWAKLIKEKCGQA